LGKPLRCVSVTALWQALRIEAVENGGPPSITAVELRSIHIPQTEINILLQQFF
jgi:hypothetical protein